MVGLSGDIQESLDVIIEGLNYEFQIDSIEPSKVKSAMESKLASFKIAKELLLTWYSSPNAPSQGKFESYVGYIINSGNKALLTLRKALTQKIDYDLLEEHKHKSAMEAKLIILNSIKEMDSSLTELKVQLETGTVNLKEAEFERGWAEKYACSEFFPLKNYYKEWYNEEDDAIVIDPKGTRGEIIELDGLKIQLPKPPKNRKEILFHDKKKEDQYWNRAEMPKGLTPDNIDMFTEYIIEEYRRRREGVWFYNNGEKIYLPGEYYFYLQWGRIFDDGIRPQFRYAQLDMFYHAKACLLDTRCLGQIFLKSRRTGFTYIMVAIMLESATSTLNRHHGLTSMTEDDAEKAFAKLSYMFQELPFFFQPIVRGKVDSPTKLQFGKPSNASKEAKKSKDTSTDGYLNSSMDYESTKAKAYDGQSMKVYLGDECFSPDTEILMSDMTFKRIENIRIGDFVMTETGKKEVMDKEIGYGDLYKVIQPHGKDYIVSENHRLILEQGNSKDRAREIIISPKEYNTLTKYQKSITRRVVSKKLDFKEVETFIPPYILGVWLGDGYSKFPKFIVNQKKDNKILEEIKKFSEEKSFELSLDKEEKSTYQKWYLKDNTQYRNRFTNELRELGIYDNKRVPRKFFTSSLNQRTELLSGIIDTDGYKSGKNVFTIGMSRKELVEDIYDIAKSCGLDTSEIKKEVSNFNTKVYKVSFVDYNSILTPRIERKRPSKTKSKNRKGKIYDIKPIGIGEYCGLTLNASKDEDRRLILRDYTVSMNCAKWEKVSYIEHLNTLLPTAFQGGRVVGKIFLGSTMGRLDKGGEDFKVLYLNSKVRDRRNSGFTPTKLYSYFLPAHKNYEQCIDKYGYCHEITPEIPTRNIFGDWIRKGSIELITEYYDDAKQSGDVALNAAYRAFPMTENHALRDEADSCVFNLGKLTDQEDYNDMKPEHELYARGNFEWEHGLKYTNVVFYPDPKGRFRVSWMPSKSDGTDQLRNNVRNVKGVWHPMNDYGCIGVDCYGSYSKGKNKQSKGAAHGYSRANEYGAPNEEFFFEYIEKPETQDIFNDDIIKAAWFYGIPFLAENNRRDFVRYAYLEGCTGFSMRRVDRLMSELSGDDALLGGIPMTSKDILDSHENSIRSFIQRRVGYANDSESIKFRPEGEMGKMPFGNTLTDWKVFDPNNRTAHDATISSGLAIMGTRQHKYKPVRPKTDPKKYKPILRKYSTKGDIGTFINR